MQERRLQRLRLLIGSSPERVRDFFFFSPWLSTFSTFAGMTIGVGSGSTVVFVVERLAALSSQFGPFACVPTSFQALNLLVEARLPVVSLDTHPVLDIAIDGADEVDASCDCIKVRWCRFSRFLMG
jgi:hypothetical protein